MKYIKFDHSLGDGYAQVSEDRIKYISESLETLSKIDKAYLERHKDTPALYNSGVKLAPTYETLDIYTALANGAADIDTLVCWRVAELRVQGIDAKPHIVEIKRPYGKVYTCVVKMPDDTIEDVQERLSK